MPGSPKPQKEQMRRGVCFYFLFFINVTGSDTPGGTNVCVGALLTWVIGT